MTSTEEEKQIFDEIYELKKQVAQLKQEKDQINSELDAITIVKEHNEQFKPGNTDQFESKVTEYKEYTDPARGALLTGRLKQVDDKIVRAQNYIDNLMSDIIRKRMQLGDVTINGINQTATTTNSQMENQSVNNNKVTQSSENGVDTSKEYAFKHLKHLYKSKSVIDRLKVHLSGKKINWSVIQNLSEEEISKLSDTFAGRTDAQMTRDEQRKEKYQAEGKRLTEINDLQNKRHWNEFITELQKKSIKNTASNERSR